MRLAGVEVRAVSVGGFETCIEVPGWGLCFDIGRAPPSTMALGRVLFTHAHVDHMGGVIHHCAWRDLTGRGAPEYWVPAESAEDFEAMLAAWRRLAHSSLPCQVRAVRPGDRVPIGGGREVVVFRAVHRVPSVGYALVERRRKLLPELVGRDGREIARLRAEGHEVTEEREEIVLAFCGDTTIDVVDREAVVREARVLVLEVTFLDDRVGAAEARGGGHVHLEDLVPRVGLLRNEVVLCTHASRRHHGQIAERLEARLGHHVRPRFVPLLPEAPWA